MNLANYKEISPLERVFVDQIFGYLAWTPCYVALLDHLQRWVLYKIDIQASKGDTRLSETKTIRSTKDLLSFYQSQVLVAFCPKPGHEDSTSYLYSIQFDQRRHSRKSVDFSGVYLHHRTGSKGTYFIHDISYSGLRFTVNRKNDIQITDKMRLSINFNDQGGRNVEKSALVRHVEMKRVGVEFIRWP